MTADQLTEWEINELQQLREDVEDMLQDEYTLAVVVTEILLHHRDALAAVIEKLKESAESAGGATHVAAKDTTMSGYAGKRRQREKI